MRCCCRVNACFFIFSPFTLCGYACLSFVAHFVYLCVCVGQGNRHAAVCRPAVPVNGGAADDTAAADGGGSEVAGRGGEAAGKTLGTLWNMHQGPT